MIKTYDLTHFHTVCLEFSAFQGRMNNLHLIFRAYNLLCQFAAALSRVLTHSPMQFAFAVAPIAVCRLTHGAGNSFVPRFLHLSIQFATRTLQHPSAPHSTRLIAHLEIRSSNFRCRGIFAAQLKVKQRFRCGQLCVCAIKSLAGQKGGKWSRGNLSNDHSFCCTDSYSAPSSRKMHCNCFSILVPFIPSFFISIFSLARGLATIFLPLLLWRSHYFCFNLHLAADKAAATAKGVPGACQKGVHVHHYSWQAQASA